MPITSGELCVGIDSTHIESLPTLAKTYFTETTLANATIKALPTTPAQLVAAPGASKMIVFDQLIISSVIATPYTNINADAEIDIGYTNDGLVTLPNDAGAGLTFVTSLLIDTDDTVIGITKQGIDAGWGILPRQVDTSANTANKAFSLYCDNGGSGNFTGGAAGNSLKITVFYKIANL